MDAARGVHRILLPVRQHGIRCPPMQRRGSEDRSARGQHHTGNAGSIDVTVAQRPWRPGRRAVHSTVVSYARISPPAWISAGCMGTDIHASVPIQQYGMVITCCSSRGPLRLDEYELVWPRAEILDRIYHTRKTSEDLISRNDGWALCTVHQQQTACSVAARNRSYGSCDATGGGGGARRPARGRAPGGRPPRPRRRFANWTAAC
jgi:hypothetical protein